jgi:hypothetical protein
MLAKPLCKKGFHAFYEIRELVDRTCATGENTLRAGQSDRAPSTQNVVASASTLYEPVIDPELIKLSLEMGRVLGEETVRNIPLVMFIHQFITSALLTTVQDNDNLDTTDDVPGRSFYEHEKESLIITVSTPFITRI